MTLSFVIPVYKTPIQSMRGCLDSVLKYSQPMELICVLDSPGDPCEKILDEYVAREPRMRVLKNDRNRGVSYSRNRGLDDARGDYITFVDADDEIIADAYEDAVDVCLDEGVCACITTCTHETGIRCGVAPGDVYVASRADGEPAYRTIVEAAGLATFRIVFKTAALKGAHVRFREDQTHGEDIVFISEFLARTGRVAFYNRPSYRYIGCDVSVTKRAPTSRQCVQTMRMAEALCSIALSAGYKEDVLDWYLHLIFMFAMRDCAAKKVLIGNDRYEYLKLVRIVFRSCATNFSGRIPLLMRIPINVTSRCPRIFVAPGSPIQAAIRFINRIVGRCL